MKPGEVYRFNYLWGHEAARGEESGRKIRRVCLMMKVGEWLYLFPLSSQVPLPREPGKERLYEVVPEIECRRIGLDEKEKVSHLILDDYNKVKVDELYDFEGLEPTGSFSLMFLGKVANRFIQAIREKHPIKGLSRG